MERFDQEFLLKVNPVFLTAQDCLICCAMAGDPDAQRLLDEFRFDVHSSIPVEGQTSEQQEIIAKLAQAVGSVPWLRYTATNAFCDQVYLHFSGDDRIYSSSSSMTVELFSRLMRYERLSAEALTSLIQNTRQLTILPAQRVISNLVDGNEPRMVTFIIPLGANPGTSKGTMLYLIKESSYQNMFADAIDVDMNTYIFTDSQVLSATEDLPISTHQALALPEAGEVSRVFNGTAKLIFRFP